MTHLETSHIAEGVATLKQQESLLSPSAYSLVKNAVLQTCDATDGMKDGLLTDPRTCHFDPGTLLCRDGTSNSCLTTAQVQAVKKIYAPTRKNNGELIFPGLPPGSELGWGPVTGGPEPFAISMWMFRFVHDDVNWDWRTFDLDNDLSLVDNKVGFINEIESDLGKFKSRGGKLLLYHGWNDASIAPENTINYYSSVLSTMGNRQDDWIRLFMAPGMNHCGGGDGPNAFDAVSALEQWVEKSKAPENILASHTLAGKVDRTRPLCPYPQVAKYKGSGSIDDAANFVCTAP
jgi:feruloyl esterase